LIFGLFADKYGRRGPLMASVLIYSIIELATAFSPSFTVFIVLRGLYGIAMGGEWGVGAALALETLPAKARGLASGILQQGYAFGYLIAAAIFGLFFEAIGWRGMFVVGALPAGVVLYLRAKVPESPTWKKDATKPGDLRRALRAHFPRFLYLVVLMAAFNFFSHGTQDVYPLFLQKQRGLDPHEVGAVAVTYNLGAILGGLAFGTLSERFGRRRTIACAALLALPVIPLWVLAHSAVWLAVGAFAIQVMVQGAWGIVPAHLNELSPGSVRGTFPGLAYQLGNLVAAATATIETAIAASSGGNYALALGGMTAVVAVFLAVAAALGPEAKGVRFDAPGPTGST
jgi:SHS family lactate transporter-like MFS transporter